MLPGKLQVAMSLAPFMNGSQTETQLLGCGLLLDTIAPFPGLAPVMGETQEVKCPWFLLAIPWMAKIYQAGLVRMKG